MAVSDGSKVSALVTNAAFVSRTVDTSAAGKVTLNNADAVSGSTVTNQQREHNSIAAYVGKAIDSVKDDTPSWTSDVIGVADEDIQARVEAMQVIVEGHTLTKMDEITGVDNALPRMDGTGGDIQLSGIIVNDTDDVSGVNDLAVGGNATITGNLTVSGTTTTIDTTTLDVTDPNVTYNKGGNQATADGVGGFTVEMSDATDTKMIYDSTATSRFKIGDAASEVEVATISGAQVLTAKDIDGGTMSNTNRLTLPKDTTTNLNALSDKEATIAYDTTLNSIVVNNGSIWSEVTGSGTGGGGAKNYFDNINNEVNDEDVTSFEVYQDSGGYVDGTGGTSATFSVASTTVAGELLEGTAALKISKAATDGLDEGISLTTRTIDRSDYGREQIVSLEIDFTDANYTDSDFNIYAYDITNSAILPVIGLDNGVPKLKGKIQFRVLTDGTDGAETKTYRLSLHCDVDSNTGSTYEVFIDDFKSGPDKSAPGYIGFGDKEDAAGVQIEATTTNPVKGTTSLDKAYYSRSGNKMFARLEYLQSGTGTAGSGDYLFTLPNGESFDSNLTSYSTVEGSGVWENKGSIIGKWTSNSSGVAPGHGICVKYNSTQFRLFGEQTGSTGAVGVIGSAFYGVNGAGIGYMIDIDAEIEGWASSGMISTTENLFKNVDVRGEGNGGGSVAANNAIDFVEVSDDLNVWDGTQFTAVGAGKYSVVGSLFLSASASVLVYAYVDGSISKVIGRSTASNTRHPFAVDIYLEAGEVLSIRTNATSTYVNTAASHYISISSVKDTSVFAVSGESELIESTSSFVSYTTTAGDYGSLTSIDLPIGAWDLSCVVVTNNNGTLGAAGNFEMGISTTDGNNSSGLTTGENHIVQFLATTSSGVGYSLSIPLHNVITTELTTYYLKSRKVNSITNLQTAYKISARRIK